jgi:hypothetical protein
VPTIQAEATQIVIRHAGEDDVPWILEQLASFDKFAGYKHPLLELERAGELVRSSLRDQWFMMALRVRHDEAGRREERLGFMAAWKMPHPFNHKLTVFSEILWWVAAPHRGSSAGLRLLDAFIRHGRSQCDMLVMTLEAQSPISPRHLLKRGFVVKETSYLLEA